MGMIAGLAVTWVTLGGFVDENGLWCFKETKTPKIITSSGTFTFETNNSEL